MRIYTSIIYARYCVVNSKNMHYVAHMEFKGIKGQMEFGEKIKTRRCELGLSQTELASVCGISLRSVQNYESGQ